MRGHKTEQFGHIVSPMSNEGRNLYVMEHITNALLKLMQDQQLSEISISQICDAAGMKM